MFVILNCERKKVGGFRRQRIETECIELENSFFWRINVFHRTKKPKMKKIIELLEGFGLPVLVTEGTEFPEYEGLIRVSERRLKAILLSNAVAAISAGSVVISDRFGEYPYCLESIMKRSRQVHVVTENPSAYSEENIRVFKTLGASASISGSATKAKYDILFSPFDDSSRIFADAEILVGDGGFTLKDSRTGIPNKYRRLCGDNLSEVAFAAALFECCKIDSLKDCVPERIVNPVTDSFINLKKIF